MQGLGLEVSDIPAVARRYYHEMLLYALEALQLVTLSAAPRPQVVGATVAHHPARSGMAVLLQAATGGVAAYRFPITTPEVCLGPPCAVLENVSRPGVHCPLMGHSRQVLATAAVSVGVNQHFSVRALLLPLVCVQIIATALQVIINCMAPPPAVVGLMQPRSITPVGPATGSALTLQTPNKQVRSSAGAGCITHPVFSCDMSVLHIVLHTTPSCWSCATTSCSIVHSVIWFS
jgi:hypothetical protein